MSFKQLVNKYIKTHAETTEDHPLEQLRTHYYKCGREEAFRAVKAMLEGMDGVTISSESKERGEMSAVVTKGKKAFVVVTIIMVKPFRTAVDFSVSLESAPVGFGYSYHLIEKLYNNLNKNLELAGKGLGNNL